MTYEDAHITLERYWAAFAAKDVEGAISNLTDDAVYEDRGIQHTVTGIDQIREFWKMYFQAAAQDFEAIRHTSVVDGNNYAMTWTVTFRVDGAFGPLQGTGQLINVEGVSVGEFRDGKIARNSDVWNLDAVTKQLEQPAEVV